MWVNAAANGRSPTRSVVSNDSWGGSAWDGEGLSELSDIRSISTPPVTSTPNGNSRANRRLRTPRSDSAVRDGRRFLAVYRQRRKDSTAVGETKRNIVPLPVPVGLPPLLAERLGTCQLSAPDLARNLDGALSASLQHSEATVDHAVASRETSEAKLTHERDGGHNARYDEREADHAAAQPSPRSESTSPERPTPEALRRAARLSQAALLANALSPQQRDDRSLGDAAAAPSGRRRSKDFGHSRVASGNGGSDVQDESAVAQWASLQRLWEQGRELGKATERQLGRATELCRDLRAHQGVVVGEDGRASAHEQTSRLDALNSVLYSLGEITAKRRRLEDAALDKADALGGPALTTSLLQNARAAGQERLDETAMPVQGEASGWLSGAQLRALEEAIESRSSLEIASLESERRKLKDKVDMFQRQVHFLQHGRVEGFAGALTSVQNDGSVSPQADGGEKSSVDGGGRIATLLTSRLADDGQAQARVAAEIRVLRDTVEEKNGLIDALREALRVAAREGSCLGGAAPDTSCDDETTVSRKTRGADDRGDKNGQSGPTLSSHRERKRRRAGRMLLMGHPKPLELPVAASDAAMDLRAERESSRPPETRLNEQNEAVRVGSTSPATSDLVDSWEPLPLLSPIDGCIDGNEEQDAGASTPRQDAAEPTCSNSPTLTLKTPRHEPGQGVPQPPTPSWGIGLPAPSQDGEQANSNEESIDEQRGGIVPKAAAAPVYAWRAAKSSVWALGSRVGIAGRSRGVQSLPRQQRASSHAVMIM